MSKVDDKLALTLLLRLRHEEPGAVPTLAVHDEVILLVSEEHVNKRRKSQFRICLLEAWTIPATMLIGGQTAVTGSMPVAKRP
jgi:hypothetical protein